MAKRHLILGVFLASLAVGPLVDTASANWRDLTREPIPEFMSGDPEWPDGTAPIAPELRDTDSVKAGPQPWSIRSIARAIREALAWLIAK